MRGKLDRRTFLKLGAVAGLSHAFGVQPLTREVRAAETGETAELIVRNGRIATQDNRRPFVSAVAI